MKISADKIKMPAVPADIASNEEILLFLQKKVVEKYPHGGVKAHPRMQSKLLSVDTQLLYVRTTSSLPAKIGWTSVYCEVFISRDEGKMEIEISAEPGVFRDDFIKHTLSWFNVATRDVLVADVEGWLSLFLESKQNPSLPLLQENTPQENTQESKVCAPSRRCGGCGAEIPGQETVCPYCGASLPDNVAPLTVPAAPASAVQQSVGQAPAKNKSTYLLLGILLGGLGIHNFYAGYKGKGIAQLLITLLTAGYGGMISWIWAIVDVCTVKQDAQGIPFA